MDTIPAPTNIPVVPAPVPPPPIAPQPDSSYVNTYAGFWDRLLANFLDGLIVGVITFAINIVFFIIQTVFKVGSGLNSEGTSNPTFMMMSLLTSGMQMILTTGLFLFYYIYFTGKNGQTFGKKIVKLQVINPDTGLPPGYLSAFLRECIGKFVSGMVLYLGYFWMIWDDKKQTWHDKIAHTVVIKL